jgi:hypothetical protein
MQVIAAQMIFGREEGFVEHIGCIKPVIIVYIFGLPDAGDFDGNHALLGSHAG